MTAPPRTVLRPYGRSSGAVPRLAQCCAISRDGYLKLSAQDRALLLDHSNAPRAESELRSRVASQIVSISRSFFLDRELQDFSKVRIAHARWRTPSHASAWPLAVIRFAKTLQSPGLCA